MSLTHFAVGSYRAFRLRNSSARDASPRPPLIAIMIIERRFRAGLPKLDDAPFQHRVFVKSGKDLDGAYGLVELFAHFASPLS